MIFHGLVYPVRWFLHIPLTIALLVVLFGIRFVPEIPLSVTDSRFVMTTALVFSIPILVSAVIRYQRELELRRLLMTELQLEAALHQLNVLCARHETLLTPWVPLPADEQVKLLRTTHHHEIHLWGLGKQTFVGVIYFSGFSSWVGTAGAADAARALCRLVDTSDKYYELISPLSASLLKCHVDGDQYRLVAADAGDAGYLLLVAQLTCDNYCNDAAEGSESLVARAVVACGTLGVAGIAASGTLTPVGPVLHQLDAMMRRHHTRRAQGGAQSKVTISLKALELFPRIGSDNPIQSPRTHETSTFEEIFFISEVSPHEPSVGTETLCPLAIVPKEKHQLIRNSLGTSTMEVPFTISIDSVSTADVPSTLWPSPSLQALEHFNATKMDRAQNSTSGTTAAGDSFSKPLLLAGGFDRSSGSVTLVSNEKYDVAQQKTSSSDSKTDSGTTGAAQSRDTALMPASLHALSRGPAQNESSVRASAPSHVNPKATNFTSSRNVAFFAQKSFVDVTVERRFLNYAHQRTSSQDLLVASVASFAMGLFLVIICIVYGTTSMEVPGPMSCSVAAMIFGVLLTAISIIYVSELFQTSDVVLVSHELFFSCFYAMVVGASYTGQPFTSPLGDTQLVWVCMLLSINFVRPRAHGIVHHVALDTMGSASFLVQAFLYPHHAPMMRALNAAAAAAVAIVSLYIHSLLDSENRKKFVAEVSLEELQFNQVLKSGEINQLLVNNKANNPAAIFAARAQRARKSRRPQHHQQLAVDSPLLLANVDPSTSTTISSRAIDGPVLVVDLKQLSEGPAASLKDLKHSVTRAKRLIEGVEALIQSQFKKSMRIVKATPTSLLILPGASVVGQDSSAATDMTMIELGMEIVWKLCPQYHIVGRAVVDSGVMMGVLLGTSSMSFEFTGPVIERAKCLVDAAVWGNVLVSQRVLRYSGVPTDCVASVRTASGLMGEFEAGGWMPWRVDRFPCVALNTAVRKE
ncbi:membrane-associated protein, putative [Bodo saltans]|uniref:Membrane-associated protein, putative n=1 Tax=Bodo saltans TaxID=75058 RepID=A0A0S4KJD9_BODSA|nr:membrane-associated protein, putative [Bodo saltans]|eukprot:CUI14645.1 membrane-associated protein, putative [Bodo saltans]